MSAPLTYSNPKVQEVRRLLSERSARATAGAFVVEGADLIGHAIAAGWQVRAQFIAPGADALVDDVGHAVGEVHHLAPNVIERVASTQSSRLVLAVVTMPARTMPAGACFVLVADRLGDPGNAGTIIRTAEAAGADAVVLTPGSVDPFNPKVVRAAAGALFRVPVVEAELGSLRDRGLRLVGASSHRGESHVRADLSPPIAVVVGSERQGLAADAPVDDWVTIEHEPASESLNVAMAATLLAFEVRRQRSRTGSAG